MFVLLCNGRHSGGHGFSSRPPCLPACLCNYITQYKKTVLLKLVWPYHKLLHFVRLSGNNFLFLHAVIFSSAAACGLWCKCQIKNHFIIPLFCVNDFFKCKVNTHQKSLLWCKTMVFPLHTLWCPCSWLMIQFKKWLYPFILFHFSNIVHQEGFYHYKAAQSLTQTASGTAPRLHCCLRPKVKNTW